MLRFQHGRACFGKTGATAIVCGLSSQEYAWAVLRLVLDFALPPLCPSCREPLGDGAGVCAPCWSRLSFIEPPYWARLGIPFAYDPGAGLLSMEAIRQSTGL